MDEVSPFRDSILKSIGFSHVATRMIGGYLKGTSLSGITSVLHWSGDNSPIGAHVEGPEFPSLVTAIFMSNG